MNTIYQSIKGNIGLGKAIEYFTSHGITVAIPLNDTQKYDLIADFNGGLQRISVKTSAFTKNGKTYPVVLKNSGGASGKSNIRKFDNTASDYVFVYTADNDTYLIPSNTITSEYGIVVRNKENKYSQYIVFSRTLKEYKEDCLKS